MLFFCFWKILFHSLKNVSHNNTILYYNQLTLANEKKTKHIIYDLYIKYIYYYINANEYKKGRTSKIQPLGISKDLCISEE